MTVSIGYIGLGKLGEPIAGRLLDTGFALSVWNRSPEKMQSLVTRGAVAAQSPAEVARQCDIVCTCVTDDRALEEVIFGDDGVSRARVGARLLIDNSTIHPVRVRELAERLYGECAIRRLDVPVSGGVPGARAGTLAAMAGTRRMSSSPVR
jgi:3-hydroxyisobutyrate dehydrogenase